MNRVVAEVGPSADELVSAAAHTVLEQTEW